MTAKSTNTKEKFILSGTAFWAHVKRPNDLSNKYQIDLSIDADTVKMLEAKGIKVKKETNEKYVGTDMDRGRYVTLTQGTQLRDGTVMKPPTIIDGKKNPIPSDINIGNGSLVNISTSIYEWDFKGKKGKSLNLGTIQIKTLVKYDKSALDDFPETDFQYTASKTTTPEEVNFSGDDNDSELFD